MKITPHGNAKQPFFKGVAKHAGIPLVFFGRSMSEVIRKEVEWIERHREELNQYSRGLIALRLAQGSLA